MVNARLLSAPTRLGAVILSVAAASCGGPGGAAHPAAPATNKPATVAPADLASGPWGEHRSRRFNLRLPLPDRPSWQIDDQSSAFLWARHPTAETELWARVWREVEPTNRQRCEAGARASRSLPEREGAEIIEETYVPAPKGFDTMVTVALLPSRIDQPLAGFALAFGSNVRRCFAYAVITRAIGKGAEQLVATRLATMVELSLYNVELEDDREPSIRRDPGPTRGTEP